MSKRTTFNALILTGLALIGLIFFSSVPLPTFAQAGRTPRGGGGASGTLTVKAIQGSGAVASLTAKALLGGANLFSGTATAFSATANAFSGSYAMTATAFKSQASFLSGDEASDAILSYAAQVLGTSVTVLKAGGVSGSLAQTGESAEAQSYAADLALKTYYGTLQTGAASLSYGSGTVTGDVTLDVQGASLGVYALTLAGAAPNTDAALALALQTYPYLASFSYTPYSVTGGFAWYAVGYTNGIDLKTKQVTTYAQSVILYVLPLGNNRISVTATVGRGDFASAISIP